MGMITVWFGKGNRNENDTGMGKNGTQNTFTNVKHIHVNRANTVKHTEIQTDTLNRLLFIAQ